MATKPTFSDVILSDVLLGYVKIQEPGVRYGMSANTCEKYKGDQFEYAAQFYLTKKEAQKLKKSAPKMKKVLSPVEADEVREKLKLAEDYELKEAVYYKLNLTQPFIKVDRKSGSPYETKQPRIFAKTEKGKEEITNTKLVSNGSIANVKLAIMTYESPIDGQETQKLMFGQPASIFVTHLIEYQKAGGVNISASDELFGDDDGDVVEEDESVKKPSQAATDAPSYDPTEDGEDDFDDTDF